MMATRNDGRSRVPVTIMERLRRSSSQSMQTLLPCAAGFLLLAVTALSALALTARQEAAVRLVQRTLKVENRLNLIRGLIADGEFGQRGYLLTGQPAYLALCEIAIRSIPRELDGLQAAASDNPENLALISALRRSVRRKIDELTETLALTRAGRPVDATAIVNQAIGELTMQRIRSIIAPLALNEEHLLAAGTDGEQRTTTDLQVTGIVSGLLVIMLAFAVIRDGRRRLIELEAANHRLKGEIDERTMAQSQVRQLQKMDAVGQLTGGIAHDVNNMLAIVIGSLDLARRRLGRPENPRIVSYIECAADGAERAATLTARLLAFSRQQPLEPKVLDVNKLVGGMFELLRRTLGEQIQLETVLAGGLRSVCADQAQVESALVNLAVNSRDAMPSGGNLTIETGNAELDERYAREHGEVAPGHYVMLSVSDTGTGMSAEVVERAFDPFFTTKDIGRGTGLGLSQVFGFVKQACGHVKIYSEIGQGTTIKLYLPHYTGHVAEAPVAP